jgi:hypothetical protein
MALASPRASRESYESHWCVLAACRYLPSGRGESLSVTLLESLEAFGDGGIVVRLVGWSPRPPETLMDLPDPSACGSQSGPTRDGWPNPARHHAPTDKDPRLLCQRSAIALGSGRSVQEVALDAEQNAVNILVFDRVKASRSAGCVLLEG